MLAGDPAGITTGMRFVIRALALWALVAFVFWVAVAVIPGIDLPSFGAALVTTLAIAADQRPALADRHPDRAADHRHHLRARPGWR